MCLPRNRTRLMTGTKPPLCCCPTSHASGPSALHVFDVNHSSLSMCHTEKRLIGSMSSRWLPGTAVLSAPLTPYIDCSLGSMSSAESQTFSCYKRFDVCCCGPTKGLICAAVVRLKNAATHDRVRACLRAHQNISWCSHKPKARVDAARPASLEQKPVRSLHRALTVDSKRRVLFARFTISSAANERHLVARMCR